MASALRYPCDMETAVFRLGFLPAVAGRPPIHPGVVLRFSPQFRPGLHPPPFWVLDCQRSRAGSKLALPVLLTFSEFSCNHNSAKMCVFILSLLGLAPWLFGVCPRGFQFDPCPLTEIPLFGMCASSCYPLLSMIRRCHAPPTWRTWQYL